MNSLNELCKRCNKYIDNENYVYKLCNDVSELKQEQKNWKKFQVCCRQWIVILQKTDNTKTNENRSNVRNKSHAKFRANELLVVEIININVGMDIETKTLKTSITNLSDIIRFGDIVPSFVETVYEVGKIVKSDIFDSNLDQICSGGIHYFKTLITAYYYRDVPKNYSGVWTTWYDTGQKSSEGKYKDGYQQGRWYVWGNNYEIFSDVFYDNGKPIK